MFYDTFAIIYKAYHYKLVCLFDLWTTRIIFFDFQSLKWTHRQNFYFSSKYHLFCTSTQSLWLFEQFPDAIRSLLK